MRLDTPTDRNRATLAVAFALGVAGDILLRGEIRRLGFAGFVILVAAAVPLLDSRRDLARALAPAALAAAALGLVLRESETLYAVDVLSVLCMGALVAWQGTGARLRELAVPDPARAAIFAGLSTVLGGILLTHGAINAPAPQAAGGRDGAVAPVAPVAGRTRAIAVGVVLALPPLLIVGGLLMQADAVFGEFVERSFDLFSMRGAQHLLVIGALTWGIGGWILGATGGDVGVRAPTVESPRLAFASVGVGLYGLVGLLTLFLATQLRVLFGGKAYLLEAAGLTVAEYAREGFFQMVAAAGIVVATMVVADWLLRETSDARRPYGAAGIALLALVGALLASAAARMALYVSHFGLTEDRLLAFAVMLWVLAALALFAATVLRDRSSRFVPSLIVATIAWVALLNAANPDAIVVRVNVARAIEGAKFDAQYHANLSADALPALIAAAPRLPAPLCESLVASLAERWRLRTRAEEAHLDPRAWSLPFSRAHRWIRHEGPESIRCSTTP